jgi:hypothetical protein
MKNEFGGAFNAYGERRDVYMVLAGKPEGKRPLGRTRHNGRVMRWTGLVWLRIWTGGLLL